MNTIKLFVLTVLFFALMDYLWLGQIAKPMYIKSIGVLLKTDGQQLTANLWPAVLVYLLFGVGVIYLVLPLTQSMLPLAFLYGALFGAVIYGVYDMTNLAVLKNWTLGISLIDWVWGIFNCSMTAAFSTWVKQKL